MGAYYEATINNTRYNMHSLNSGLKLMEHSYLENDYCKAIEYKLLNKPQPLVWLCDYHESDDTCHLTWETTEEESINPYEYSEIKHRYIVNHSKGIYIDTTKLSEAYAKESDDLVIHPLPILCNSDIDAQGGGDYHVEDSRRSTWCLDIIGVYTSEKDFHIEELTDVSLDCLFFE